jgi:arabinose-5-phosphate isomerase
MHEPSGASVNAKGLSTSMQPNNHIENAKTVIDIEIAALLNGKNTINNSFSDAVELIRATIPNGRAIVMGMGKSGHIGKKIAATLASTGSPAFFVHPAEAGHGDLGMITRRDVVIAISQSGKSDELLRVIPYFKRNGIKIIAMTGSPRSPLATHADIVINTAVPEEACPLGLAPTASTTLTLALGDALAVCLLKAAQFTENDFAATHPHGMLGRRLLVGVRDVMASLDHAPVIRPDNRVKDALFTMSKGAMGFIVIIDDIGKPLGVFTDGDLRRCLDRDVDIKTTCIADVMISDFVSIRDDQLAVAAVDLMEKHKVSALPVLGSDGRLAGALNMRQLLQAGVV